MTTERELQSALLRLCVICATSLATMREPVNISILPSSSSSSSIDPDPPIAVSPEASARLTSQIHADILSLFELTKRYTTALSLALKPSCTSAVSNAASNVQTGISPISGLDSASLGAAKAQLTSLVTDVMPKLVFLAKKANKERKVVKALEGEAAEIAKEQRRKENAALEEAANELGGTVMPASESERGPPPGAIKLGGVGETWAKEVRFVVEDVVEAVSSLAESFLDPRTRAAVCAAERARNRSSGGSAANTETADEDDGSPATVGEARQKSLAAMNAVWAACERAASRLPRDNRAAVRRRWKERAAVMDDGLEEMLEVSKGADAEGVEGALQNALEGLSVQDERAAAGADEQGDGEDDDEEDDEMDMFGNEVDLSPTERARVAKIVPLVRIGKMLHHRVLTACIGSAVSSSSSSSSAPTSSSAAQLANSGSPSAELDMDELETEATTLSEAQDDLVASVVYGTHDLAVVREATEEYVSVALRLARIAGASAAVLESLESARDVDAGAGGRAERKALKGKVSKSEKDKAESDKTGKAYFELCAQQLVRLERALEE